MDDEPLAHWAARRQGRLRKPGELKAITLGTGPLRAAHLDPDAPRMILEWDGFAWQPLTTVHNYAAACQILNPALAPQQSTQPAPKKQPGRHRKP
ncbi:DUF6087 family protein [Streptomyces sp. NBC_00190]|uniref:DUF6087 family protein n=1 Tax=unclassified Streptomyces TaxID=2593676 RepID=UPI002E2C092E|nr:DUF6087 family protein [Streptomyces sp. NBC_00190]WSZ37979.1 DUF6087 family protein [Streptomyces sp. NBC_00868]